MAHINEEYYSIWCLFELLRWPDFYMLCLASTNCCYHALLLQPVQTIVAILHLDTNWYDKNSFVKREKIETEGSLDCFSHLHNFVI